MNGDPLLPQLLLQLALILLNAIFACAEIAVISMNDIKLAAMAASGDKRALRLSRLTSQPARFLATIQVAITLSGFLGSAFAADNFASRIVSALTEAGVSIPPATLNAIAVILITLILSFFTLVLGELVPKRVAMKKAEALALGLSGLIAFVSKLFKPLVSLLTASTNGILRLLGIDPDSEENEATEENIRMMVDVGSEKGAIDSVEREMIQNVFEFNDTTAGDILRHRTQVVLLWTDETDGEWAEKIHESRYSHYPILEDSPDNIIGILNAKDYFRLEDRSRQSVMEHAVSAPRFVPDTVRADKLFSDMKKSRNHFSVVLDEYGGMCGIVTMNDLIEEIVGDLGDDDGEDDDFIEPLQENAWRMGGGVTLEELAEATGEHFDLDDVDTLSGLALAGCNEVPEDGTAFTVEAGRLTIRVEQLKNHRVVSAVVTRQSPPPETEG